jgi:hypothetical protein
MGCNVGDHTRSLRGLCVWAGNGPDDIESTIGCEEIGV